MIIVYPGNLLSLGSTVLHFVFGVDFFFEKKISFYKKIKFLCNFALYSLDDGTTVCLKVSSELNYIKNDEVRFLIIINMFFENCINLVCLNIS